MARLAFISLHTSPADMPGAGDAGGMNVVEREQALALAALGHEVDIITRRSNPDLPDALEFGPGVTLRHLTAGPPEPLAKSRIDAFIPEFAEQLATLPPYDLIHSHHWMSGVAALPVAHAWGVPHVQSFHSVAALPGTRLENGEPPESDARVAGEALTARESDAVVAISAAEARTVIERCGADPTHVHIVSPGVDGALFRPLREGETAWPGDDRWAGGYVLFAGRLQPLKGPSLAICTMAEVPAEIRPHLVIAGDVSADFAGYADELHKLVGSLGLDNDVTFIGPQTRDQLALMLRGARVVLVPSHSETFGLIALEAESSGTPVIAASAGGLREAVAHLETGHLMDSRLPADWGRALCLLLTEPGVLHTMGVVARVHAERFEWSLAAYRLSALYDTLIKAARA